MAEENIKKLSEYLNLNIDRDWSEVKADLDKSFLRLDSENPANTGRMINDSHPEIARAIVGKYSGSFKAGLKKLANDIGVELTWSELQDEKATDVLEKMHELTTQKFGGYESKLKEYEDKVKEAQKSGALAKDIEAAQKQVEEWKQKYEEEKQLRETSSTEFEKYKAEQEQGQRKNAITQIRSKVHETVPLRAASPYEKKGFIQDVDSKCEIDFDNGEQILRDKNGKRIPHPEKHGQFMNYEEFFVMEATKANMLEENPHKNKPVYTPPVPTPRGDNGAPKKNEILHPSLRGKQ